MTALVLPTDAVSVRRGRGGGGSPATVGGPVGRVRARGVSETALRRQLAQVATPEVRRFVFIRRVRLRASPRGIGAAMHAALTKLADGGPQEVLTYADFPALVVACVQAALGGG